jgi:hypothetical protein
MHQTQSVGEHTWQVLRIWLQVFGSISTEVVRYLVWHDAGELVAGDAPFPVKVLNPNLKLQMDSIEHAAVLAMHGEVLELSDEDRARVKACELFEMHEHGRVEWLMGNKFARPIMDDCWSKFMDLPLSVEDNQLFAEYIRLNWSGLACEE